MRITIEEAIESLKYLISGDCTENQMDFVEEIEMAIEALEKKREPRIGGFSVIDNKTGKYPDLQEIALKEGWAFSLKYCDMEGFAITESGSIILLDECGEYSYCPSDRFTVVFEEGADHEQRKNDRG